MMDKINDYLNEHREVDNLLGREYVKIRPRIECADGFIVSVQASHTHYCTPRDNRGPYSHVECGYPSEKDELLIPFIEVRTDDPTSTVYPWVPVEVVEAVIEKHGGMKEQPR